MKITVVGGGYVGLVTALGLYRHHHDVALLERDPEKVGKINAGFPLIHEPDIPNLLTDALASGRFLVTIDPVRALEGREVSFVCVDTPSRNARIDTSALLAAASTIADVAKKSGISHTLTIKSTVVPGTTEGLIRTMAAAADANAKLSVACNPEFLREGSALHDFLNPDRIVIGTSDHHARNQLLKLYSSFDCPKFTMSLAEAEFVKYASNALLGTLISFSNQIAALGESLGGVNVERVFDALHYDQRLTPVYDGVRVRPQVLSYLRPGIGFGGSCLPKDIIALRAFGLDQGVSTTLLDAVLDINEQRAKAVADMAERLVGPLRGTRIAVLGIAFKPGTNDLRESPAIACIHTFAERGAKIRVCDPLVTAAASREALGSDIEITEAMPSMLEGMELAFIASACPDFVTWDWDHAIKTMAAPNILDGRQLFAGRPTPAGATYVAI